MTRTLSTPRRVLATALAAFSVAVGGPALAQEDLPPTEPVDCSTTSTPRTSTTPGTPEPCPTSTAAPPPRPDQAGDQDSPPESVPLSEETIPPPPGEPVDPLAAERLIRRELRIAQAEVLQSAAEVEGAATLVDDLSDRVADLQQQLAHLDVAQQLKVQELEEAQVRFKERIANAVVRGNAAELDTVMTSQDGTVPEIRKVFLASVSEADSQSVADLEEAKAVIDQAVLDTVDAVAETRRPTSRPSPRAWSRGRW